MLYHKQATLRDATKASKNLANPYKISIDLLLLSSGFKSSVEYLKRSLEFLIGLTTFFNTVIRPAFWSKCTLIINFGLKNAVEINRRLIKTLNSRARNICFNSKVFRSVEIYFFLATPLSPSSLFRHCIIK